MEIDSLNEIIKDKVGDVDWAVWNGAAIQPETGFASDKTIFVREEYSDATMFKYMEQMDILDPSPKFEKLDREDALYSWNFIRENYGVNELEPLQYFDLQDEDSLLFPSLILLRNKERNNYVLLDGRRYRILIETVPVHALFGKGDSDPVVAVWYDDENGENIVGSIAPVTDRAQKYIKHFRKIAPELNL